MSEAKLMFDRFWQQYPQGSIISDLVQIHDEQYVVKVSIKSADTMLVATLAADTNLMLAENRATEKALAILGITAAQPAINSVVPEAITKGANDPVLGLSQPAIKSVITDIAVQPLPDLPTTLIAIPPVAPAAAEIPVESLIIEETTSEMLPETVEMLVEVSDYSVEFYDQPTGFEPDEEIDSLIGNEKIDSSGQLETLTEISALPVEPIRERELAAKTSRAQKTTVMPDLVPEAASESAAISQPPDDTTVSIPDPPLSVTDMIPLINMELKRLGWSKERGRDYMVSLYNKRASALLSDEELFGLLQHLKAEPIV
jgi:hypothetical protein